MVIHSPMKTVAYHDICDIMIVYYLLLAPVASKFFINDARQS